MCQRCKDEMSSMEVEQVPFNVSLPLLGVGAFTLLLSLCFCCYLWRLKKNAEQTERGFSTRKYVTKDKEQQYEKCPVCLEEFKTKEKIAVCRCQHSFHSSCLMQWLSQRNTCPLCKAPVKGAARETTGLIAQPQFQPQLPPQPQPQPQLQQQAQAQPQPQYQLQQETVARSSL